MGPLTRTGGEENDCSLLAATMDSKIMRIAIGTLTRSSHDVFAPEIVRCDVRYFGRSRALIWEAAHANPDEATPASHSFLLLSSSCPAGDQDTPITSTSTFH